MNYNTALIKENITVDLILDKTTEFDIYRQYIGNNIQLGKAINSPLRTKDNNPSFVLYKNKSNKIMYKDFGTGEYGDCFNFVSKVLNVDFKTTLEDIWYTIASKGKVSSEGLKIRNYRHSRNKDIFIKSRYFSETDNEYWGKFNISRETLKRFNVTPIQHYWINDTIYSNIYKKDDPAYAFKVYTKFKIYRPCTKDKKDKFRTSCGIYDMFGLEQLIDTANTLIITKSLKDVMILYELGYNAIATQGESCQIPKIIMDDLKNRFKYIYILYDNDKAGINGSIKLKETYDNLLQIFIPKRYKSKDIGELIENKGFETSKSVMKKLIKHD